MILELPVFVQFSGRNGWATGNLPAVQLFLHMLIAVWENAVPMNLQICKLSSFYQTFLCIPSNKKDVNSNLCSLGYASHVLHFASIMPKVSVAKPGRFFNKT